MAIDGLRLDLPCGRTWRVGGQIRKFEVRCFASTASLNGEHGNYRRAKTYECVKEVKYFPNESPEVAISRQRGTGLAFEMRATDAMKL
jgi:hypothetical protein